MPATTGVPRNCWVDVVTMLISKRPSVLTRQHIRA
jgi:hypothetical protein